MSKSMGDQGPRIAHLVHKGKGGLAGEIADVRSDVDLGVSRLEGRDAALEFPELDWMDGGYAAAAGGDLILKGRYLLQGQEFASLTLGVSLDVIMREPGEAGNLQSVEVVDTGAGGLAVTYADNRLEVDLGGATPDEDTIATAINNAGLSAPVRANSGGGGAVAVTAEANLTGGAGEGWSCTIAGFDCPIKFDTGAATSSANLAEGEATVTVPALTGTAIGDPASATVVSDGVATQSLSGLLA